MYTIALLESTNEAPPTAKAIVETMETSGELALAPSSLHWNQVLSCYANAGLRFAILFRWHGPRGKQQQQLLLQTKT